MSDILIHKLNEATASIEASDRILTELNNYFSVYANNYRWSPKYKSGFWDGKIRFMRFDNTIPIGLISRVREFAKLGKYSVETNFQEFNDISPEDFKKWSDSLNITGSNGEKITLRGYQLQAAYDACKFKHLNIESVTSSGKSVIIYLIIRFLIRFDQKILLIVPRTQLVHQLKQDFVDYGWEEAHEQMHLIYGGQKKVFDAPVICSTWQSLYKNRELFECFDALLIDEAHGAKGTSISGIGQKCFNAEYRIGTSGTYPETGSADWHSIVGTLGPIKQYTTYKKLQNDGHIAELKIYALRFNYHKDYRKILYKMSQGDYNKENDELIQNDERTKMITNLVKRTKGNTIVLFTKIEKHGRPLLNSFKEKIKDKHIFYVDGSVDMEIRENIRTSMEQSNNIVLLASYGTFAEGVNIKNIHNVVFASSYKSKIKVLQSLGRGLRKLGTKVLKLFDIVDDVSIKKSDGTKYMNHSLRHYEQRKRLYKKQGFEIKEVKLDVDFKG